MNVVIGVVVGILLAVLVMGLIRKFNGVLVALVEKEEAAFQADLAEVKKDGYEAEEVVHAWWAEIVSFVQKYITTPLSGL
jgi:hypothetical protein